MSHRPGSPPYDANFEKLRDAIYKTLLSHVERGLEPDKRFFPVDTAEKVLQPDKLESLFGFLESERRKVANLVRAVEERKLHTFLAILVYSRCTLEAWTRIVDFLIAAPERPVKGHSGPNLAELPLQHAALLELFGDNRVAADLFQNHQEYFCAVVLRNNEEVICQNSRRLPYLEEERINTGYVATKRPHPLSKIPIIFSLRNRVETSAPSRRWEIGLSDLVKSCEFGPNAQPLVCVSKTTLRAYSLQYACREKNFESLIDFGIRELSYTNWSANIGVSSRHIVAATNNPKFEVYVYFISDSTSHTTALSDFAHIVLEMPPIVKLAISPDSCYVAVLLQEPKQSHGSVYILHMDQIESLDADRFSSATSSSSGSSIVSEITLNHHSKRLTTVSPAADIRELKFSASKILYTVIKPKRNNTATENFMTIQAWIRKSREWEEHRRTAIGHDGQDDLLQGLYTSFTPHDPENAKNVFTILSQEKRVLTRRNWDDGSASITQSKAKGYRLLRMLSSGDDEKVYCFGTNEAKNELRLLNFPPCHPGEEFSISKGIKLPGMTHQSKFAASLYYPTGTQAVPQVLVADIKGRTVRILDVDLQAD